MVKHETGKSPAPESSETRYKGVRRRTWGKYVSEIRFPNSRDRIWLGSFDSAKKAARAFDAAQFCLRGHSASFNFPDNPPNISGGRSLTPPEIQVAARQFANLDPEPEPQQSPLPTAPASSTSSSSSGSETEACPDSPSVSERAGHESESDPSIVNLFATMGPFDDSYNTMNDPAANQFYEIFPGFDDLRNDFFMPPPPALPSPVHDYNNIEYTGSSSSGFQLWNF